MCSKKSKGEMMPGRCPPGGGPAEAYKFSKIEYLRNRSVEVFCNEY